jgi:hypothetical protein
MRPPPKLPDLGTLTDAQKDELIVSLWQTLIATDAAPQSPPAPPTASVQDWRERIGRTAPSRRARAPAGPRARLGRELGFLESKLLLGVLVIIGLGFLADSGIGWYEQRVLDARSRAALELRDAAFAGLYIELVRVTYEPDDKSYRASLTMQNENPDVPLYIMMSPAQVFVQSGFTWQEVPAQAPKGTDWGVVRMDAGHDYQIVFQADVKDWTELIPGYMHVRIQSDMLISRSAEPKDDIVERDNRFYVYLKPQGSDDAAIRRRSNFPGDLPVFIPMPPH